MNQARLFRLLWLSIAAAVATISLKTVAWLLTGSVGLLSDAAESVVNLVAAVSATRSSFNSSIICRSRLDSSSNYATASQT
jgi:divalent metal cation (Fe/Co/Zn/Cd) transporter